MGSGKEVSTKHGVIALIVVSIAVIALWNLNLPTPTEKTGAPVKEQINVAKISIGEEGRLYNTITTNQNIAPVCTTKENFDEMVKTVVANDKIGFEEILRSSKCYLASTLDDSNGDFYGRILILDKDQGAIKFRFVHSDALHYGKTAWTYQENIIPIK